jgi:hypothetical protein
VTPTFQDAKTLLREVQRIANEKAAELRAINRYAALDFSPFKFIDSGEVQTTHLLAFFLSPDASHGQGDIFQRRFLEKLRPLVPQCELPAGPYRVEAERRHDGLRQIDLLLRAPHNAGGICIENKLFARDQDKQLHDYHTCVRSVFPARAYLMVYLTPQERPPEPHSISSEELSGLRNTDQYINITYYCFITQLIDDWIALAFPEKVKTFLKDWRSHLNRYLFGCSDTLSTSMAQEEIIKLLLENPALYQAASLIQKAYQPAAGQLLIQKLNELGDLLNLDSASSSGFAQWRHDASLSLSCETWGRYKITFAFDKQVLFYGVSFASDAQNPPFGQHFYPNAEELASALAQSLQNRPGGRCAKTWRWPLVKTAFLTFEQLNAALLEEAGLAKMEGDVRLLKNKLDELADADELIHDLH